MKGPEDSKAWRQNNESDSEFRETRVCRECKKVINLYHCSETGCPWCAACGVRSQPSKKEKS